MLIVLVLEKNAHFMLKRKYRVQLPFYINLTNFRAVKKQFTDIDLSVITKSEDIRKCQQKFIKTLNGESLNYFRDVLHLTRLQPSNKKYQFNILGIVTTSSIIIISCLFLISQKYFFLVDLDIEYQHIPFVFIIVTHLFYNI